MLYSLNTWVKIRAMSTSRFITKTLAASAALGLVVAMAPLTAYSAQAASVSPVVKSSCRTNGAPLKYNVTRAKTDKILLSAPDSAKAGEKITVRLDYRPEKVPGKESIATMRDIKNIALRFTIDDPASFVTAKPVPGTGQNVIGTPKVSLVGKNTLVYSGMTALINGKDTEWKPPLLDLVFKPRAGISSLPTIHPAVEGAAGQFNNPANFVTMKSTTDTKILGSITVQLNCQSLAGTKTLLSIPVSGGAAGGAAKSGAVKKAKKSHGGAAAMDDATADEAMDDATADDPDALQSVDTDESAAIAADDTAAPSSGGMSPGAIALTIISLLVAIALGGFIVWDRRREFAKLRAEQQQQ